ncbi:MAG: DUF664 domain-containing protein [Acidimicrobiia bacterium]|nr:DinB family protein [Acidimicrobiia bacterium]NNC91029.1 DUF664 domain-containing protein [Acidimicrobiia bacterium]
MEFGDLFTDAFARVRDSVTAAVGGLTIEQATYRPDPDANSVAWLVWHLTRVQDSHVSELAGRDQEWVTGEWNVRFGTASEATNTGYGHTSQQVAEVVPDAVETLSHYHQAVFARTGNYLGGIDAPELERIIDRSYEPPVSVGVRLVSVVNDNMQHAGQAGYVRGMVERLGPR